MSTHTDRNLSRDEFARALKQGRGSARMHVLGHGLNGVEELVLRACLENQAYDRQCEDQRAAWLYPMIKDAPQYGQLSAAIVSALAGDPDEFFNEQVCELAAMMARDGDESAARALRTFVWSQPDSDGDFSGGHAIVALDGMPALVEIVQRLGRYLQDNPNEWVDSLDYLTEDGPLAAGALNDLALLATDDTAIAAYVAMTKVRYPDGHETALSEEQVSANWERYRDEFLQEWPVGRILDAAGAGESTKYSFVRFGRYARADDVKLILERLHAESDVETCRRLLWSLSKATLPGIDSRIWEFANNSASGLRREATIVLSSIRDSRVGELGRQRLRDGDFCKNDDDLIKLFILNFQLDDVALIVLKLDSLALDDGDAHAFGFSVREVCAEHRRPELAPLAEWVYRTNPCTICRNAAFERLQDMDRLPALIASEYQHDAKRHTRTSST